MVSKTFFRRNPDVFQGKMTLELLRIFIQKIVVHEKEVKWSKHAPQTVEIYYADIGCMENRQTAEPEQHKEIPKVS